MKLASILNEDPLDFYLKTSLYPGTAPLLSQGKQSRIINLAFRENIYKYPLFSGRVNQDITELKFCPVCRKEDINMHGYTWLRKAHHMPGVSVCWKHGVRLGIADVDRSVCTGQLSTPDVTIEEGVEAEKQYSLLAKEFLETGFDVDRSRLIKIMTEEMDRKKEHYALLKEVHRVGKEIGAERLLRWLFEVFHDVSKIPVIRDDELFERFTNLSDGYELHSNYSADYIRMQKNGESDSFITTPWGFIAGWRSPLEDCNDEQKKIAQIVKNIRNGEYEPAGPITSMDKPMKFLHKSCGEITLIRPWDLIENGVSCFCTKKSAKNIHYARKRVEEAGNFKLISVADDMTLKIHALDCGHEFEGKALNWYDNPGCRICKKIDSYAAADADFKKKVYALVGDKYKVTGQYVTINKSVEILHLKCGKITSFVPIAFLRGSRCECDTKNWIPKGKEFRRYVKDRSCGRYEITGYD